MEDRDLRCRGKRHGLWVDQHTFEVKCDSRVCGAGPGVVVLHRFNLKTGAVSTKRYRDPVRNEVKTR